MVEPRRLSDDDRSIVGTIGSIKRIALACRFPALTVAGVFAALLLAAQGKELAVRLVDESRPGAIAVFYATLLWWAAVTWLWSRTMLNLEFPGERPEERLRGWLVDHVPRILSMMPFGVAGLSIGEVDDEGMARWIHIGAVTAAGCALYFFLVKRRDVAQRLRASLVRSSSQALRFVGERVVNLGTEATPPASGLLAASPWPAGIRLSFAAALGFGAWAAADPLGFGWSFGLPAGVFVAFAGLVPVGSYLVHRGERAGIPAVSMILALAFAFSVSNDNHDVRTLADIHSVAWPKERRELAKGLEAWSAACLPDNSRQPEPVVVVATAGGGIRAAYWTATVLGAIQDRLLARGIDFSHRVVAISGVSGGSLGAAVYVDLLRADGVHCAAKDVHGTGYAQRGQAALSGDLLSPVVTAMMFGDLLQRFQPFPRVFADRAVAHERSFEASLASQKLRFDAPFRELWLDAGRAVARPALFLNGTHQETGRRIVLSNFQVEPTVFVDTYDFFALVGRDTRVSTAVLNSARFTYVSPAGTLRNIDDPAACEGSSHCGHIVDGGYFENSGSATARDVMHRAFLALDRPGRPIRPIVIQISSDPDMAAREAARCGASPNPARKTGSSFANDVWAPVDTLLNTRTARGVLAVGEMARLHCGSDEVPNVFVHFLMCNATDQSPPLGWVLAGASKDFLARQLLSECGNDAEMEKLLKAFEAVRPAAGGAPSGKGGMS